VTDDSEIIYTETLDEALAVAFDDCPPGTIVTVHSDECEGDDYGEGCTCPEGPQEYVVGAKA
jgi:hypothetical protein